MKTSNYIIPFAGFLVLYLIFVSIGCEAPQGDAQEKFNRNYSYDPERLFAVVEVPAGSYIQSIFDFSKNELINSEDSLDFLPYPGNYGFLVREVLEDTDLERGDYLSCLILSSAFEMQEVVEVVPVGVLTIEIDTKKENIIICVPLANQLKAVKVKDFVDLMTEYEAVRFQIQHWFANFQGPNQVHIVGWEDEEFAMQLIEDLKRKEKSVN